MLKKLILICFCLFVTTSLVFAQFDELDTANVKTFTSDLTVDTSAYAAGDSLVTSVTTISNAVINSGGKGTITTITVVDQAAQNSELDLVFFDTNPSSTTFTANGALDIADADNDMICGIVTVSPGHYVAAANNSSACVRNIGLDFQLTTGTDLYVGIIVRSTPTYAAAGDIRLKLVIRQE